MKTFNQIITIIGIVLIILSTNNVNAQDNKQALNFEESVALTFNRLPVNSKKKSVRAVKLTNFNKNFKLPNKITINDVELNDNGKDYDKVANDGIYTSKELYSEIKGDFQKSILTFDNFKYENDSRFKKLLSSNKAASNGFIKCTIKYLFGFPSFHCEINIEW